MLLMLSLLTVVHEWGHFIVARLFHVKVNEFSIFMGPKIFQRRSKKTGILFSLRALPIGGYCALEGEVEDDPEEGEQPAENAPEQPAAGEKPAEIRTEDGEIEPTGDSFSSKPWYIRALILVAGVTMNYLLAVLIISIMFGISGYDTRSVSSVSGDMPAALCDLQPGDQVIEYNGMDITTPTDYSLFVYLNEQENTVFTVKKADGTKVQYVFERDIDTQANDGADKETNPGTISVKTEVYECSGKKFANKVHTGTYEAFWDNNRALTVTLASEDGSRTQYYYGEKDGVTGLFVTTWTDYAAQGEAGGVTEQRTGLHETLSDEEYVKAYIEEYNTYSMFTKYGFSYTYGVKGNVFQVIGHSVMYAHTLVKSVLYSLLYLITGRLGLSALSGPIGMTSMVSQVVGASAGAGMKIMALLEMTALISVNLAVFNLLPLPGLDGGKLLFILIELLRGGKKVPAKVEGVISFIVFALLILLAIVVAGSDIVNLVKR